MPPANSPQTSMNAADFTWLTGSQAINWLEEIAQSELPLHTLIEKLRRDLSGIQCHLLLEQVELRRRAAAKFTRAAQMLFSPRLLEQATDEWISRYKAQRFAGLTSVADLCCGAGGDLIGLAERCQATAFDKCDIATRCASHNSAVYQTSDGPEPQVIKRDVKAIDLAKFAAWQMDPDRRPQGRRTTRVELHEPTLAAMVQMLKQQPNAAIKLAPGSDLPTSEDWNSETEFEWISRGGECRQLVAWRGSLAERIGQRRATNISPTDVASFVGQPDMLPEIAETVEQYLFEPDPAVRAAHLTGALAVKHNLKALAPGVPYLTGQNLLADPLVASFEVEAVMPFDRRKLATTLRQRGVGRLEIKHRGIDLDPDRLRGELKLRGDATAVLLIARIAGNVTVIIAKRTQTRG